MKLALFLILLLAVIILYPFAIIWALNTLFPALAIGYGFFEWLAIIIVTGALKSKVDVSVSK